MIEIFFNLALAYESNLHADISDEHTSDKVFTFVHNYMLLLVLMTNRL